MKKLVLVLSLVFLVSSGLVRAEVSKTEVPRAIVGINIAEVDLISDAQAQELGGQGWVWDVVSGTFRDALRGKSLPYLIFKGLFGYAQPCY